MATDEVVEAVAKALYDVQLSPVLESHAWERADPALQEDYRTAARAALGAEPVARMVRTNRRLLDQAQHAQEALDVDGRWHHRGYEHPLSIRLRALAAAIDESRAALEPFAGITEGVRDG